MKSLATKKLGIWFLAFALFMAHLFFRSVAHADTPSLPNLSWKQVYMKGGECSIAFPSPPQLIQQVLNLAGGQKLLYDVYVSAFENKAVFLLLVATYPQPLAQGQESAGLEALVQGIVSHHADNELVFAEKIDWNGHQAIHFLVQGGANYFRGQALMVGNKLFLMAMEGKEGGGEEALFAKFVRSFQLSRK